MEIVIGSDHGGYAVKESMKKLIEGMGYKLRDYGTYSTDAVDYPDFAHLVAQAVSQGNGNVRGIMIDAIGVASAMVANKVPGVRAAVCNDVISAKSSREHNDANMLTFGGKLIGPQTAEEIVKTWLNTDFAGGRHSRRVEKIVQVDDKYRKT
ncbi:MAG: ribose 5-phosphate isomerase B [Armatimonadota bacterium]